MINKLTDKLTDFFSRESETETQKEIIRYGINILIMNIPKTFFLVLLSLVLGIFKETLTIMLLYGTIRFFSYGFHFKKTISCFIFATIMYVFGAYLSKFYVINDFFYIFAFIISFILYLLYAPCGTESHPIGREQYKRNKLVTVLTVLIMATFGFFSKTGFKTAVIYSIVSQAINIQPLIFMLFKQKGGVFYDEQN